MFSKVWLRIVLLLIVLFGTFNWLFIGVNRADMVYLLPVNIHRYVYLLIGIAGVMLLTMELRNLFIPSLGRAIFPCGVLNESTPTNADLQISLNINEPGDHVIYWASESQDDKSPNLKNKSPNEVGGNISGDNITKNIFASPEDAYQGYDNAGVAKINGNSAMIKVRTPSSYTSGIFFKTEIKKHVHYRVCNEGMLSEVHTIYV